MDLYVRRCQEGDERNRRDMIQKKKQTTKKAQAHTRHECVITACD